MPDSLQIAQWAALAAEERKAQDVLTLDLQGVTLIADYFVICSGRSTVQVKAIAENVIEYLKKKDIKPLHQEGVRDGYWVLLDYGSVVVHVFREEERGFYSLERLWGDARQVQMTRGEDGSISHVLDG